MKQTERERQQFPGGTCTEGRWSVLYVGLVQYTLSFTPDLQKNTSRYRLKLQLHFSMYQLEVKSGWACLPFSQTTHWEGLASTSLH